MLWRYDFAPSLLKWGLCRGMLLLSNMVEYELKLAGGNAEKNYRTRQIKILLPDLRWLSFSLC